MHTLSSQFIFSVTIVDVYIMYIIIQNTINYIRIEWRRQRVNKFDSSSCQTLFFLPDAVKCRLELSIYDIHVW